MTCNTALCSCQNYTSLYAVKKTLLLVHSEVFESLTLFIFYLWCVISASGFCVRVSACMCLHKRVELVLSLSATLWKLFMALLKTLVLLVSPQAVMNSLPGILS